MRLNLAGIKIQNSPPPDYPPYLDGLEQGVFVEGLWEEPYTGQARQLARPRPKGARSAGCAKRCRAARWPAAAALGSSQLRRAVPRLLLIPLQSWAGGVHYPDFWFNPGADRYWAALLRTLRVDNDSGAPPEWSGLWLDMNEGVWGVRLCLPACWRLGWQTGLPDGLSLH